MTKTEIVNKWIDENKQELFDLLRSIVRIDTQNQGEPDTCDESELSYFMEKYYKDQGWTTDMYAFDKTGKRFNVVGDMKGTGGGDAIMFNAHLDTVPIGDASLWTKDPLGGEIEDGYMYGRGVSDCKSGMAAMSFAARALQQAGIKLKGDVLLVPSVGEESAEGGDCGLGPTTKAILEKKDGPKPKCCVVCEQTDMDFQVESPSLLFFEVICRGKAVHVSSRNQAVFPQVNRLRVGNEVGVDAIEKLRQIMDVFERKERDWNLNWFKSDILGNDDFNGVGTFTLCPVYLSGGTYLGSIPDVARVTYALWYPMSVSKEDMMAEIRRSVENVADNDIWMRDHKPEIRMPILQDWPGFRTDKDCDFVKNCCESFKTVTGRDAVVTGFKAVCDATWAGEYGIDSVVFGAGGTRSNIHGVDENAPLEELVESAKIYAGIMMNVCGVEE